MHLNINNNFKWKQTIAHKYKSMELNYDDNCDKDEDFNDVDLTEYDMADIDDSDMGLSQPKNEEPRFTKSSVLLNY